MGNQPRPRNKSEKLQKLSFYFGIASLVCLIPVAYMGLLILHWIPVIMALLAFVFSITATVLAVIAWKSGKLNCRGWAGIIIGEIYSVIFIYFFILVCTSDGKFV